MSRHDAAWARFDEVLEGGVVVMVAVHEQQIHRVELHSSEPRPRTDGWADGVTEVEEDSISREVPNLAKG